MPRPDHRLRRAQRIRRRSDFTSIQEHGARVGTAHFSFLFAVRPGREPARLGIVASRKVGNAVRRNRIKRLVREAFRRHAAELAPGLDLVVIARPGAHELSVAEVEAELAGALPRIRNRARALAPEG